MQIDMHFYGVYALARAAGIEPGTARTIAHCSQFVDDGTQDELIILPGQRGLLPIMTSHRPLDYKNTIPHDQWRVWIPFHFLPGNQPESGTLMERMVCRKGSDPARKVLDYALDLKNSDCWPHLIGIAAHVYADTFSHFGFLGLAHPWNRVKSESIEALGIHSPSILRYIKARFEDFKTRFVGSFAELIPIGHAAVATYPDRPYLKWRFEYEMDDQAPEDTIRENPFHFLEACKGLYDFFYEFGQLNPQLEDFIGPRSWDSISGEIEVLLRIEAPREGRIRAWKEAISGGLFCHPLPADQQLEYKGHLWQLSKPERIPYALRFYRASRRHRDYVLQQLLPELGILL